jgi:hypothetical protein
MAWINLASFYGDDDRLSCSILDDRVMADLIDREYGAFVFC